MTWLKSRKSKESANPFWNFERNSPRCTVQLLVRSMGQDVFLDALGDVGMGGFCVRGETPFPAETLLEIVFFLPEANTRVRAIGRVISNQAGPLAPATRGRFLCMRLDEQLLLAGWLHEAALSGRHQAA